MAGKGKAVWEIEAEKAEAAAVLRSQNMQAVFAIGTQMSPLQVRRRAWRIICEAEPSKKPAELDKPDWSAMRETVAQARAKKTSG